MKENGKSNGNPGSTGTDSTKPIGAVQVPNKETIVKWVRRDLEAAHYFLGLLLRYPSILETAAKELLEHSQKVGAPIETEKPIAERDVVEETKGYAD